MKTISVIVVACSIAAGAWWVSGDEEPSSSDSGVTVVDQVWIDQMPVREKDKVAVFAMLSDARIGIYNESSAYEGDFSLFEFKEHKGKIALTMLQSDQSYKLSYKISNKGCGKVFDYCLKVKGAPRGPKVYGSMRDWVIDSENVDAKSIGDTVLSEVFSGTSAKAE